MASFRSILENLASAEKASISARTSAMSRNIFMSSDATTTTTSSSSSFSSSSSSSSSSRLEIAESKIQELQREILTTTRDAQSLSLIASQQLDDKSNELNATRSLLLVLQEKLQKAQEEKFSNETEMNTSSSSSTPSLPPPFLIYAKSIDSRVQAIELVKERLEKGLLKVAIDLQGLSSLHSNASNTQQQAICAFSDLSGVSASLIDQFDRQKASESLLRQEILSLTATVSSAQAIIASSTGTIEIQRAKLISQSAELDLVNETLARRSAALLASQDVCSQQESFLNKLRGEVITLRSESDRFGTNLKQSTQSAANEISSKNAELLALANELAAANDVIARLREEGKGSSVIHSWNSSASIVPATSLTTSAMEDDSATLLLILSEGGGSVARTFAQSADMTPTTIA